MNSCTFTGRMTRDAEDIGNSGEAVKFTVAVDGYDYSARAKKTTFVPFVAFGKVTAVIRQYAPKGQEVGVTGKYQTREYTPTSGPKSGIKQYEHNFVVQEFELLAGKPAGGAPGTFSDPGGSHGGNDDAPGGW